MFIEQQYPVRKVLKFVGVSSSSFYFEKSSKEPTNRGVKPSEFTLTTTGQRVPNEQVVTDIKAVLTEEFVDYGYLKMTYYLKDTLGYMINHKKVYRLMQVNRLLYRPKRIKVGTKQWVSQLVPEPTTAFSYWEFDIKYMYIHGTGKMVPLLTVIDVYSRWVLGHLFQESIKKEDVKQFFRQLIETYVLPQKVFVRCDNGSQFESTLLRDYFISEGITQEFTKPATPEQNAHIESYHSILEKVICRRYEFESKMDCAETLKRWQVFYNYKRIHSGINYKSPNKYLLHQGIEPSIFFAVKYQPCSNIFISLNETETSSAEEQLVRDSSVE